MPSALLPDIYLELSGAIVCPDHVLTPLWRWREVLTVVRGHLNVASNITLGIQCRPIVIDILVMTTAASLRDSPRVITQYQVQIIP